MSRSLLRLTWQDSPSPETAFISFENRVLHPNLRLKIEHQLFSGRLDLTVVGNRIHLHRLPEYSVVSDHLCQTPPTFSSKIEHLHKFLQKIFAISSYPFLLTEL
ncbi:hypothetical protein HanIR_Chr03g0120111 [Helianthus annuus]|nr:hypothetical protein HanIR_Chr03g0120111 [Helianthus annuus]